MKLTINQLARLFEKYGDAIEIRYFDDVGINNENYFVSGDLVLPVHLRRFSEKNIAEIEVFYTPAVHEYLAREFPLEFRPAYAKATFTQMDRILEGLKNANSQSKRKRFIRMVGDVYGMDLNRGRQVILLRNDEPLDYRKWNNLKRDIDQSQLFSYRNSELIIIIFVNLTLSDRKIYIEHFKINTDLISLIVTRCRETAHCISPDFIPT